MQTQSSEIKTCETVQSNKANGYIIRPVQMVEAENLLALVNFSKGGLSSLQPRLNYLKDYIQSSLESFSAQKPLESPHKYLLGLFEPKAGKLIGCAAVKTRIGIESPFINFDIQGDGLDEYLIASSRYTGATEVGSLFLHPDYRAEGLGRYLAKVRYLLIASEPWRFEETIIAELRGICGPEGSPLYDYMFEDKLDMSFLEADAQYYDRDPNALGDIVPIGKIPTAHLPLAVKASIGHPHKTGVSAMRLLQSEGFIFSGTIDLFDAGPIMSVYRDTIRTIMQSQLTELNIGSVTEADRMSLISVGNVANFRAVIVPASVTGDITQIDEGSYEALKLSKSEPVRIWQSPENRTQKDRRDRTETNV